MACCFDAKSLPFVSCLYIFVLFIPCGFSELLLKFFVHFPFVQNLAEAEYCVAVFMYMRLLGYPAEKISILTTYNGQKHLIRDVVNIRCAKNPLIGMPHKVSVIVRVLHGRQGLSRIYFWQFEPLVQET